jgi:hypothetical protein
MPRILSYDVIARSGKSARSGADQVSETHLIATDSPVSMAWITTHSTTPKKNMPAKGFPGFFWDDVSPTQKAPLVWEFNVTATAFEFPREPDSPLAVAAEVSVDSELIQEATLVDWKNRPLMTTAAEWINGKMRERPVLTFNIVKNLGRDPAWMLSHLGSINTDAVTLRGVSYPKYTLMLRRMSLSPYRTEGNVSYTVCSYSLHLDPLTWIQKDWNVGTIELVNVADKGKKPEWKQKRIKIGNQFVEQPVPLDRKGQVIPGVLTPEADTPVDVSKLVPLEFHLQPEQAFNGVLPLR